MSHIPSKLMCYRQSSSAGQVFAYLNNDDAPQWAPAESLFASTAAASCSNHSSSAVVSPRQRAATSRPNRGYTATKLASKDSPSKLTGSRAAATSRDHAPVYHVLSDSDDDDDGELSSLTSRVAPPSRVAVTSRGDSTGRLASSDKVYDETACSSTSRAIISSRDRFTASHAVSDSDDDELPDLASRIGGFASRDLATAPPPANTNQRLISTSRSTSTVSRSTSDKDSQKLSESDDLPTVNLLRKK